MAADFAFGPTGDIDSTPQTEPIPRDHGIVRPLLNSSVPTHAYSLEQPDSDAPPLFGVFARNLSRTGLWRRRTGLGGTKARRHGYTAAPHPRRHARSDRTPRAGNCVEEVNLSSRGVEQAKRIGEAFRVRGIAVGEVETSPYCRCVDTGKLAFGRATPVEYLMPPGVLSESHAKSNQERVSQDIRDHRSSSNLVMITHDLNISNIVLEPSIAMGDLFVLQPNGTDFDVIGKIRMGDK